MMEALIHETAWLLATLAALGCSLTALYVGSSLLKLGLEGSSSITAKHDRWWLLARCVPGLGVLGFGLVTLCWLLGSIARLPPP